MAQKDLFKKDLLKSYFKERKAKQKGVSTEEEKSKPKKEERKEIIIENAIQIVSDIHLEFPNVISKMPKLKVKAPILALLGDIGYPKSDEYQTFIKDCASQFQHVIIITGNHEYYTDNIYSVHLTINQIVKQYNNVYFLNGNCLELPEILPNIIILGCTLWVKFDDEYAKQAIEQINDYTYISTDYNNIKPLTVNDTNNIYDKHMQFILKQCENAKLNNKKIIMLTHHSPTDYKCIDPNYFNRMSYLMNFTNIEHLLQPPIIAWFFGHTHFNMDLLVKCNLKQMKDTENDIEMDNDNNNEKKENKINEINDKNENDIWYVRIATNQQGYLHRGIADRYILNKVIKFPIEIEKNNDIEVIDYSRLVTLPFIKRLNNISDAM
eukprot:359748_1